MTRSSSFSTAVSMGAPTVHRVNATATDVADDVGRQLVRFTSTAATEPSTIVGQTRSVADCTPSTAKRTSKETIGQTRAQSKLTGKAAGRSATTLLDDATRAFEPDGDGKPAALDDWSKAELYERAQELDIDGRSSMRKRGLVRTLRSA